MDGRRPACHAAAMANKTNLQGARALVTGATGGLGHAIARALHAEGAGLVLTGRREEAMAGLAAEPDASTVVADLADPAEGERLLAEVGDLDVLVLNHALPATGYVLDMDRDQVERLVAINLTGQILLAQRAAAGMVARGSGHVVLISSLSGKAATQGSAMYNATKFGLRGFGLAFRQDLHGTGVSASVVLPGFVRDAGMFADAGVETPGPVGTVTPEDVGRAVVKAIVRDKAEVEVAGALLRGLTTVGSLAPGTAERVARRATPHGYVDRFIAGQADKQ